MKTKITKTTLLITIAAFVLVGCSIPLIVPEVDVTNGAESTAVAQTVAAQITQIAQDWTATPLPTESQAPPTATPTLEPTSTPLPIITSVPTNTPVPTTKPLPTATSVPVICNAAEFVKDMTVYDGAQFAPNTTFVKIWRLKNVGSCTWTKDYQISFDNGDKLGGSTRAMPQKVAPGEIVDIQVEMKAPSDNGSYKGYWILRDEDGDKFGIGKSANGSFWVAIKVVPVKVSYAYDFAKNFCKAAWKTDNNSLFCHGTAQGFSNYVQFTSNFQMESGKIENEPALIINVANGERVRGVYPAYTVQAGDHFVSQIGCVDGSKDCKVKARLTYRVEGTNENGVLGEWIEKYNGKTTMIDIDLSGLVGKNVVFVLDVSSLSSSRLNEMFWFVPSIRNP